MDMYSSLSVLDWAGDWGAEVANNEAFDIWGENFDLSKWSAADAQAF
jgi:hypothetical protein